MGISLKGSHTTGTKIAKEAVFLAAKLIKKHLTLTSTHNLKGWSPFP